MRDDSILELWLKERNAVSHVVCGELLMVNALNPMPLISLLRSIACPWM